MLQSEFEQDLRFTDFIQNEFKCKCYWQGSYPIRLKKHFQKTIDAMNLSGQLFIESAYNEHLCPIPSQFALYSKSGVVLNKDTWNSFISQARV